MKNIIIITCLILCIASSCNSQNKNKMSIRKKAIALNDRALHLGLNYFNHKDSVEKAIRIFNEAIIIDSTFEKAYLNKASFLCQLGSFNEMLKVLSKAKEFDKDNPLIIMVQAHILEKLGRTNEAVMKYKEADILYDRLIKSRPDLVQLKVDKASLQLFLKSKEEGIKQYEAIVKYSNDPYVIRNRPYFYDFDKKEFIKDFCLSHSFHNGKSREQVQDSLLYIKKN